MTARMSGDSILKKFKVVFLVAGGLVLLLSAAAVWHYRSDSNSIKNEFSKKSPPNDRKPVSSLGSPREASATGPQTRSVEKNPSAASAGNFVKNSDKSPIESLLKQKGLSSEEMVTGLLECTRREDLPMEVRLDALDHAANLDRWRTVALCMEESLPAPIAARLLNLVYNLNKSPEERVAACMYFINHEDVEVSERARGILSFLISAEEHMEDPERLLQSAEAFLGQSDEMENALSPKPDEVTE